MIIYIICWYIICWYLLSWYTPAVRSEYCLTRREVRGYYGQGVVALFVLWFVVVGHFWTFPLYVQALGWTTLYHVASYYSIFFQASVCVSVNLLAIHLVRGVESGYTLDSRLRSWQVPPVELGRMEIVWLANLQLGCSEAES